MQTEFNPYVTTIIIMVALIFASGIYMLYWASKKGYMQNLEAGARSIFTEEEPEGVQTDFFPNSSRKTHSTESIK